MHLLELFLEKLRVQVEIELKFRKKNIDQNKVNLSLRFGPTKIHHKFINSLISFTNKMINMLSFLLPVGHALVTIKFPPKCLKVCHVIKSLIEIKSSTSIFRHVLWTYQFQFLTFAFHPLEGSRANFLFSIESVHDELATRVIFENYFSRWK